MVLEMQKTLKKDVIFTGKGLHTGRIVRMVVKPARANHGIVFERMDSENAERVVAHVHNITSTELCTTVGAGASSVSTIEHLMAAFAGLGIDNALVEVNAPEVPIMDGSSRAFVAAFLGTGIVELSTTKKYFVVKKPFQFVDKDRVITVEPAKETSFECSIDFPNSFIGRQQVEWRHTFKDFLKLADARTFCHLREVNALKNAGLAQGGSLENAIVVTDAGVLNEEGLRFEDEFVRHKLLDCIGDLALLGGTIVGKIRVFKPGHNLHAGFMNALLLKKSKFISVVEPRDLADQVASNEQVVLVGGVAYS